MVSRPKCNAIEGCFVFQVNGTEDKSFANMGRDTPEAATAWIEIVCAALNAASQLPERIAAQRGGITEIDPAHGTLQDQGAQLAGQRMGDTLRAKQINKMILKCGDHAAVEGFSQQQGTAVAGGHWQPNSTRTEPLHGGDQVVRVSPMGNGALESLSVNKILILNEKVGLKHFFMIVPLPLSTPSLRHVLQQN